MKQNLIRGLLRASILFFLAGYIVAMEEETGEQISEKSLEIEEVFSELPEELKYHVLKFICGTRNLKPENLAQKLLQITASRAEKDTIVLLKRLFKCINLMYPDSKVQGEIFKTKGDFDSTALLQAVIERSRIFVQLILNHIKNLDKDVQIDILKAQDKDGVNALISAVINGFIQITKLILDHIKEFSEDAQVAILNTKDSISKQTILMRAATRAKKQDLKIIELILGHIKSFSKQNQNKVLEEKNINNKTALDYANYYYQRSKRYRTNERIAIIKLLQEALKK